MRPTRGGEAGDLVGHTKLHLGGRKRRHGITHLLQQTGLPGHQVVMQVKTTQLHHETLGVCRPVQCGTINWATILSWLASELPMSGKLLEGYPRPRPVPLAPSAAIARRVTLLASTRGRCFAQSTRQTRCAFWALKEVVSQRLGLDGPNCTALVLRRLCPQHAVTRQ